jgi:peptidoglycan/xylan/chitin deacetylase (PgdA/CDA1 family)
MLWRNDDLSYGIDIRCYKKIQKLLGEYGIKEHYSVIPVGYNIFIPDANLVPREKLEALAGTKKVNEDLLVDMFIRDALKDGHKIMLHGFRHINFAHVMYDEQYEMIQAGKEFLEYTYDTKIEYFIPPYNSYNKYTVLICNRLGLKILDSSGNRLEKLVENNEDPNKTFDYYWYHAWRFFKGNLNIKKLKQWLDQKLVS